MISYLDETGLTLRNSKTAIDQPRAFSWLNENRAQLEERGFSIRQTQVNGKKYFLGNSSIDIEIKESIDWFDIYAIVRFGEYEMPFNELRKYILKKKFEFELPNGGPVTVGAQAVSFRTRGNARLETIYLDFNLEDAFCNLGILEYNAGNKAKRGCAFNRKITFFHEIASKGPNQRL